jgi:hypothetical protein
MPDKGDSGSSESRETLPGGERVLIHGRGLKTWRYTRIF